MCPVELAGDEYPIDRHRHCVATMEDTITLYRPTGPKELELVRATGFRRWPPRLPEYVTRFAVRRTFIDRYEVQKVGAEHHTEWWIPAEKLQEQARL